MSTTAAAIKWLHSLMNVQCNPVDSPIIQQIVVSYRKDLHRPPVQKKPLTFGQLMKILDIFAKEKCSLIQLRTACYVCIKFTLLFRHNEIAEMKGSHISYLPNDQGLQVFIPKSKTDTFRQGNVAFIPFASEVHSPYQILLRFMNESGIGVGDDRFIFTPLTFCSSTKSYKCTQNKPLSYTRCREIFLDALKSIGITDTSNYGLHSLRSGGATRLAQNDISEELIMLHGRWKTSMAKNRYVDRDLDVRLKVSKAVFS